MGCSKGLAKRSYKQEEGHQVSTIHENDLGKNEKEMTSALQKPTLGAILAKLSLCWIVDP